MRKKHTPGPWKAIGTEIHPVSSDGITSTVIVARAGRPVDADLIAAAPDLLEAAKAMVAGGYVMGIDIPKWAALKAAIAKAGGGDA